MTPPGNSIVTGRWRRLDSGLVPVAAVHRIPARRISGSVPCPNLILRHLHGRHPLLPAISTTLIASFLLLGAGQVAADWPSWGGDAGSTKYAPYDQIHAGNLDSLRILWRYRLPTTEDGPNSEYKGTPIVVDGVLYTLTPSHFAIAIDAATGQELWRFDAGGRSAEFAGLNRGLAYWRGEGGQTRILFGTNADTLYCLDAVTGRPDPAFGANGRVDLTLGLRAPVPDPDRFGLASPPTVVGDVAIVGSIITDWHDGVSPDTYTAPGDVRGYDVRTGALLWTFHTIPQPGEAYYDEWDKQSWDYFGSANVWATISADAELGIAYLPVSSVSHDRYGGERPGRNLFSDCLVAVDARTGERLWHYQFVHHTLWNYDPPAAPVLLDVEIDGRPRKIVVQLTKQAMAFVFDRVTGEPIWPIEERPVPTAAVDGEAPWPTQPFPTKPAPYDLQGLTESDLIDFTPALRREALEIISAFDTGPLYTPPSLRGTIQAPGELGGTDWVGGSADVTTGVLYVPSKTLPWATELSPSVDPGAFSAYGGQAPMVSGPQGLPLTKPPYTRITAIDMTTGEHLWMRPIGRGPIDHPALQGVQGLPDELGWPQRVFLLTTPTLLMATTGSPFGLGTGGSNYFVDREATLRAYDKSTGALLGQIELTGNTTGGLISYEAGGRQYVAATTGGRSNGPAEIVAVGLPRAGESVPVQAWTGYEAEHPRFEEAVARLDAGAAEPLAALLDAEPALVHARGYLDELFPIPSQRGAQLLHLTAGSLRARLPDNILAIAQMLLDHGADAAALTADSTSFLDLVVASQQLGWLGLRDEFLTIAIEGGAQPGPELMFDAIVAELIRGPFPEDHFNMAHSLHAAGLIVDLPFAAALGLLEDMAQFFDTDGQLLPTANTEFRPHATPTRPDQEVLDISLCYAAYGGHEDAVDWLLARGANINGQAAGFVRHPRADAFSGVNCATWSDDGDMIRHLASLGADLTLANPMGFDPAWLATFLDRPRATAVLRELLHKEPAR